MSSTFTILHKDIIQCLGKNGPMIRSDLVKCLNRARTTIYDNLDSLISQKVVKKYSRPTKSRGRPLVFFKVIEE